MASLAPVSVSCSRSKPIPRPTWPWPPDPHSVDALFQFGWRANSDSLSYEIADLFGAGQADCGFRFEVGHASFGGKTAWNTFAKGLVELGQQLGGRGWVHEGRG